MRRIIQLNVFLLILGFGTHVWCADPNENKNNKPFPMNSRNSSSALQERLGKGEKREIFPRGFSKNSAPVISHEQLTDILGTKEGCGWKEGALRIPIRELKHRYFYYSKTLTESKNIAVTDRVNCIARRVIKQEVADKNNRLTNLEIVSWAFAVSSNEMVKKHLFWITHLKSEGLELLQQASYAHLSLINEQRIENWEHFFARYENYDPANANSVETEPAILSKPKKVGFSLFANILDIFGDGDDPHENVAGHDSGETIFRASSAASTATTGLFRISPIIKRRKKSPGVDALSDNNLSCTIQFSQAMLDYMEQRDLSLQLSFAPRRKSNRSDHNLRNPGQGSVSDPESGGDTECENDEDAPPLSSPRVNSSSEQVSRESEVTERKGRSSSRTSTKKLSLHRSTSPRDKGEVINKSNDQ